MRSYKYLPLIIMKKHKINRLSIVCKSLQRNHQNQERNLLRSAVSMKRIQTQIYLRVMFHLQIQRINSSKISKNLLRRISRRWHHILLFYQLKQVQPLLKQLRHQQLPQQQEVELFLSMKISLRVSCNRISFRKDLQSSAILLLTENPIET